MAFELSTGTAAAALDGSERIGVLQGGAARAATVTQVKNFVGNTTLSGDVSGTGSGGITTTIGPHAVGFSKFVTAPSAGLVGANASGDYQHVTIGAGLTLTAGVLAATGGGAGGVTDGDKGDIVVSSSGSVWTIDANAVSFAKHVAAPSAGIVGANAAGNYQHVTIGTGLSLSAGVLSCTVTGGGGSGVTDGDKGDIVISGTGTIYTIDANVVGFSKFAAAPSAGLVAAGAAGNYQHFTLGSGLSFSGTTLIASGTAVIATRTALAALTGMSAGDMRFLSEAGREGWFKYSTANLSTSVTNDPGQGVVVPPSSATTGASGAWVRDWKDRLVGTWFGATGDGTTNDLTAVTRAINYALFVGGAEVFYPIGVYSLGASGVVFPLYNGSQWKTVKITGAGCVQEFGTAGSFTMPTTGTMFITTATSGAAISVAAGSGSYAPFSGYCIYLEDFTVRCPSNPSCSGIDLGNALQHVIRNVEVDTGVYSNSVTAWTTTTSAGIVTAANNNAALSELYNVAVSGFYKGIVMNEHANVIGGNVTGCANALWYEFGNHSSWYQGKLQNNPQNFVINGACVFSAYVNIEHAASGSQVTTADIKDVGSLCVKGEIHWSIVKALVGQDTAFLRTGGNNIIDQRFGTTIPTPVSVYRLAANQSIPTSTDTAITFAKSSGGGETSLHAGDATKIDINTTGTYRVSFIGAWAANGTGDRVIAINHQHGAIDIVAKAAQPAASASNETCQSCISTAIPYSGGAGEYLQALVNQASGGALNLLGGVNRSGVLTIEKLA